LCGNRVIQATRRSGEAMRHKPHGIRGLEVLNAPNFVEISEAQIPQFDQLMDFARKNGAVYGGPKHEMVLVCLPQVNGTMMAMDRLHLKVYITALRQT